LEYYNCPGTESRTSSAGRWDAHKKLRADGIDDDGQSSNGMDDMSQRAFYAGPGFLAAPELSIAPHAIFVHAPRCCVMRTAKMFVICTCYLFVICVLLDMHFARSDF
jgi:hypothetical protein